MITQIISETLAVLITALVFWAWTKYIKPWLVEHRLM